MEFIIEVLNSAMPIQPDITFTEASASGHICSITMNSIKYKDANPPIRILQSDAVNINPTAARAEKINKLFSSITQYLRPGI
jgi:hypothetical protein